MSDFANVMIRASAGTGKTFRLTNRYLALLAAGQSPARILASTFTRKAAGEILDRIVARLADAASDPQACEALNPFLEGAPPLNPERAQVLLQRFLSQLHVVRISTLDSFFSRLARSFSLELGLSPGWMLVDELVDQMLRDEAIHAVLKEEHAEDILHLLAKGAAERSVSRLVRETVDSLHSIYRAAPASAWEHVKRKELLSSEKLDSALQAVESYPLDDAPKSIGTARLKDLERFAERDWKGFLATGLAKSIAKGAEKYGQAKIPPGLIPSYERLVEYATGALVNQLADHTHGTYRLLQAFDLHFDQLKKSQGAYRFEDITFAVSRSVSQSSLELFAFRQGDEIDHLLLDEFQDTSPEQWAVVKRFAERTVEPKAGRSFFCVGDVKQAIYGWRGGEAAIFEAVTEQLNGISDGESLDHSWRSAPAVINSVNRIFENLHLHKNLGKYERPVHEWARAFNPHTAQSREAGFVNLEVAAEKDLILQRAVERIVELHQAAPAASIGVLTRKNATVNELIYLLAKAGVPASEEGGNPLTDSAAVNVLLALLRWIDHPADTVSLFHVATSPLGSQLDLPQLYPDIVRFSGSTAANSLGDRLRRKLVETGYQPTIQFWARALWSACNRRETTRLNQFIDLASQWDRGRTLRSTDFIDYVEKTRISEPSSAAVRVMTVHQSKGLEFDAVVLPELSQKLVGQTPAVVTHTPQPGAPLDGVVRYANQDLQKFLPKGIQKWFDDYESRVVHESLCVLYVALTRARRALYLIVPPNPEEKNLPKQYDGLLRAALCDGAAPSPDLVLYREGNADWFQSGTLERRNQQETESSDRLAETANDKGVRAETSSGPFPLRSGKRSREIVSPSSLEGGSEVSLALPLTASNQRSLYFGTLIHKFFEQIRWLDEGSPTDEQLTKAAREVEPVVMGNGTVAARDEIRHKTVQYFRSCLETAAVRAVMTRPRPDAGEMIDAETVADDGLHLAQRILIERADTIHIRTEHRFLVQTAGQILQGSIDRLVEYWEGDECIAAEVIDFKTDRIEPGNDQELDARVAHYRPQMQAYCRAVAQSLQLPMDKVWARLLFVNPAFAHVRLVPSRMEQVAR